MSSLGPDKAFIFRITHIENVPWILQHGPHCRNASVCDPDYRDIGSPDLIAKRAQRQVPIPPGGTLSDYVPFYFTPHSPMLLNIKQGNLLDAPAEALVNTVNEVGVMGKGIALMFRDAFPENTRTYEAACKRGEVMVGRMLAVQNRDLSGPRWIINFPTKKHWRHPSKLEWVREGLLDLVRVLAAKRIRSVALPPLGCGNGGLEWNQVRREIEAALAAVPDVEAIVFEPTSVYQNAPKRQGLEALTPARSRVPVK